MTGNPFMEPVRVIENSSQLMTMIDSLARERHIAIDTESNSFYAYFERLCLIQVSTETEDYIIDPLVRLDLGPLGEILANPDIEKILHAASNDVLGFKRDYNFKIQNLFDTAVACKLLGYQQLGLARILEEHFGVELDKKWQRHNWGKRPLMESQLNYARYDTHYLISLRHRLAADLKERELWEVHRLACEKICDQELQIKRFRPESFMHINGARALDSTGKRILKALYLYREQEAKRRNRAPFRILSNETLLRLANQRPKDVKDFSKIKGLPRTYYKAHAARNLLELIRKTEGFSGDEAKAKK
jgi:ribonuclease D